MSRSEKKPINIPGNIRLNILLLMSGSIACAKASILISEWYKRGHRIRVVCTRSVAEFTGPATLQGLGAESVLDNVFAPGQAMQHIELGKWADVIIAAPATSNLINKLATGIADDAVTTVWQAAYGQGKPMLMAPAMNTRMWRYPATQNSVQKLQQWGIHVLPVASGELACGETGEGRLLEPVEILQHVDRLLEFGRLEPKRADGGLSILVTAGGTREPIDSVRYIGNLSSGRSAAQLTDELTAAGNSVTWLGAEDALMPLQCDTIQRFSSFADLAQALQDLLAKKHFDVVIHAAAVSDFSVAKIATANDGVLENPAGKLPSDTDLVLHLKRNSKLLTKLKGWSVNPEVRVIGFKLTNTDDSQKQLAAVRKQFAASNVDAVVHNDLTEITVSAHPFSLHVPEQKPVRCADTRNLARSINALLETT